MQFPGSTALITGAGHGIGRATALALAAQGARVVIADVNEEAGQAVAREIGPGSALAITCDVSKDEDVETMRRLVLERYGAPDLLINNAFARALARGRIDTLDLETCRQAFDVNVLGNLRVLRAFVDEMERKTGCHVVDTSSSLVILPSPDAERSLPYLATKGAILGVAYGLAYNMRRRGIGYSLFCPGLTDTAPAGWRAAPLPGWTNPAVPTPPAHAAEVLLAGLRQGQFLISSQAGYTQALIAFAESGNDPFAGYDFNPRTEMGLGDGPVHRSSA